MSKRKRKVGDKVIHNDVEKIIVEIRKGEIQKSKPQYQSGVLFTGYSSGQPKYVLNDGKVVTGGMIKFI